jgi:hypothetical protein
MTANDSAKTVSTDGSASDTQKALDYVNGKNADGWVVTLPAGKFSWGSTVVAKGGHSYTIQGSGDKATTITSTHNEYASIAIGTADNKLARLTNFIFKATGTQGGGFLVIDPPPTGVARNSFRIDHAEFIDCHNFTVRINEYNQNSGISYGLFDHCDFKQSRSGNGVYVIAGNNANQWKGDMTWGTVDTVCFEDCTWTNTSATVPGNPAIDSSYNGARYSVRHCRFTNWVCVLHGADSAPTSTLQVEFHHNTLEADVSDYGLYCRGGCIMASDNTFKAGSFPNQCFKFANDSPNGFQKVGQGVERGVTKRLGAYFWNNKANGNPNLGGAPGLSKGTDFFDVAPGPGLPTTSYTELQYPHPLATGNVIPPDPPDPPDPGPTDGKYYVSSSGKDTNAGTTAAPWKNCPGMVAWSGSATLKPGDTVYFDRAGTWAMAGGDQGLYLTGGVTYIGNSWGSGSGKAILRASGVCNAGTVRFRDDPSKPTVFQGFEVDTNHQVNNGVDINHRYYQMMNGAVKRLIDCDVHDNYSDQTKGQYTYGIVVSNNGGSKGLVANVEIIGCKCFNTSRDAICLYPADSVSGCNIDQITVRQCEAYNTGKDPAYSAGAGILIMGYVTNAFIEYNYVHDTKGAMIFVNSNETNSYAGQGPTNIHIRYNVVGGNNNANGAIRVYDGRSTGDPKDLKVYGNIVYNSSNTGGLLLSRDVVGDLKLLVYNNTFYNAPVVFDSFSAKVLALEFKNNLCVYNGTKVPLTDISGKISAHSDNLYRASGVLVESRGIDYPVSSLELYEQSALSSDPMFTDVSKLPTTFTGTYGSTLAPAANGLSLKSGSPALNAGVDLAAPYNGSINSLTRTSGAFDMGSYESTASGPVPPDPPNPDDETFTEWTKDLNDAQAKWIAENPPYPDI